ncbi:MAG: type II secretion system protein [Candidatus Wallbacteria bacterium]|nr:type II secretion system protein [Candidatus Wallbacteria bacterium]
MNAPGSGSALWPRGGFSMVEVLVGMLVLSSAAVLVTASLSSSSALVDAGRTNSEAASIANQQLDWYVNYPEATSLPPALKIEKLNNNPSPTLGLKAVSISDTLGTSNSTQFLTSNSGTVGPPNGAALSPAHQDFLYDKELVVMGAKIDDSTRKYQCDIYARPPGGARGQLLYSATQLSVRLDPRSGK